MTVISKNDTTIIVAIVSGGKNQKLKTYTGATIAKNNTSFCYEISVGSDIVHTVGYQGTNFMETIVAP